MRGRRLLCGERLDRRGVSLGAALEFSGCWIRSKAPSVPGVLLESTDAWRCRWPHRAVMPLAGIEAFPAALEMAEDGARGGELPT